MTIRNPMGYKFLRTWQQACEIFELTEKFVATLPTRHPKTGQYLTDLKDQMIRSARSVVRNIEEGYARVTTREYVQFLGYSIASLEELLGDYQYCEKGELGETKMYQRGIYLCRGESKMLTNQMKSLENKMVSEKTLSQNEMIRKSMQKSGRREEEFNNFLEDIVKKSKSS